MLYIKYIENYDDVIMYVGLHYKHVALLSFALGSIHACALTEILVACNPNQLGDMTVKLYVCADRLLCIYAETTVIYAEARFPVPIEWPIFTMDNYRRILPLLSSTFIRV